MSNKIKRRKVLETLGLVIGGSVIAKNAIADPTDVNIEFQTDNKIKFFNSLKDARQSDSLVTGDMIVTLGYYTPGDGGGASYAIVNKRKETEANNGDVIQLNNGNLAILSGVTSVNYQLFGAVGDTVNDDGVQIKMAHDFANRYRLPVINMTGEYWLKETRDIVVKTPVNWGLSIFHIDENYNTRAPVFLISGYQQPIDIDLDRSAKKGVIDKVKPGVQEIPELKEYVNCLVIIRDDNEKIGFRSGYPGQSRAIEEFFYVEEHGRILGDIAWTFKDYTRLTAIPAEDNFLTIEGGTFYISGEGAPSEGNRRGYLRNGFVVERSRTLIKNQWVGLEKGKSDTAMNPRSGFYSLNTVYDVTLENIRLLPWEKDRPGTDRDVPAGTYGIGGNRMLKTTFRNITAEGTFIHWGVFGTNLNKDFRIENCRLNRVDVHFHCWNLTIKDSHIGNKGITITGGGELIIENTSCESNRFVNFRRDFGAKWDGKIVIHNCTLKPNRSSETAILDFVATNFNYGYPIGLAKSISVEDFVIDFRGVPENNSNSWLIRCSDFAKSTDGRRSFFPEHIHFKDISCEGREKGLRLMDIPNPQEFFLPKRTDPKNPLFESNASIRFENIQMEKTADQKEIQYHLVLKTAPDASYDENSLYPSIQIKNCNALAVNAGNATARILVENSEVNRFVAKVENPVPGEITFQNCRFLPQPLEESDRPYQLSSRSGTSFINCLFHLPRIDQQVYTAALPLIDFIDINRSLRYNHINSRLGQDVLKVLKERDITLNPVFISKLKNHHELEE